MGLLDRLKRNTSSPVMGEMNISDEHLGQELDLEEEIQGSKRGSFISNFFGQIRKKNIPELVDIGIIRLEPGENYEVVESFFINEPHSKVVIYESPEEGRSFHYFIEEVELGDVELVVYDKLVKIIGKELEPPSDLEVNPYVYVREQAQVLAEKYKRSIGKIEEDQWERVLYYILRNIAGYGGLDPLFRAYDIEDISCNGLNKPLYVWHRKYESIPTNLMFSDEGVFNDFIIKLAHKGSKHISSAHPILDATLPEKHRLAATFQREVSSQGSSFCIRKFSEDPISIIDLLKFGTVPPKLAAYFWVLLENRMNYMILGGTGAGKTSLLNAILSMIPPNLKLITVEEVSELNPPHSNWVSLVSRKSYSYASSVDSSIELFDLVKLSLRYRPDYIIVGEVRGEEAFTLFQAIATGHGGLCTMHADNLDHAVKRLTSEPMNISDVYIPLMNISMYVSRVELPQEVGGLKFGRRVRNVWEILETDRYVEVCQWDPRKDEFIIDLEKSSKLREIAELRGVEFEDVLNEINSRTKLLSNLTKIQVRDQTSVTKRIQEYLVTRDPSLFPYGSPDPHLVESTMVIKDKEYKIWRYPKGGYDPVTKTNIGGRIVKRSRVT